MRVISIGSDRKIFEPNSQVYKRQLEYSIFFDSYDVIVFSNINDHGEINKNKISQNISITPTNSKSKIAYLLDAYRLASKIIDSYSLPDIVITVQDPFEAGIVGLFLKLRYKIALHVQVHVDYMNKYFIFGNALNLLRTLLSFATIPLADSIRVVSKKIEDDICDMNKKITILPIHTSFSYKEGENKKMEKNNIVLTVARLEKEKDITSGIEAFSLLLKSGIDAKYYIVGEGREKDSLVNLTKILGISERVTFFGYIDDVSAFYSKASVYLSSSLYEGYGMTLVEATLAGLPIVMTDTGLSRDMFVDNHSAMVVKQRGVKEMSAAMEVLLRDKEFAKKLSQNAKEELSHRQISIDQYIHKYVDNIKNTLSYFDKSQNKGFVGSIVTIVNSVKILRYAVGGFSVAITQILILYLLTDWFGVWYLLSSILSFCYAVVASFLIQKFWTFKDNNMQNALKQFIQFVLVAIIGIVVNTASMFFWVELVGIWYVLAQVFTGALVMIINFLIYRFVIFRNTYEVAHNNSENR